MYSLFHHIFRCLLNGMCLCRNNTQFPPHFVPLLNEMDWHTTFFSYLFFFFSLLVECKWKYNSSIHLYKILSFLFHFPSFIIQEEIKRVEICKLSLCHTLPCIMKKRTEWSRTLRAKQNLPHSTLFVLGGRWSQEIINKYLPPLWKHTRTSILPLLCHNISLKLYNSPKWREMLIHFFVE